MAAVAVAFDTPTYAGGQGASRDLDGDDGMHTRLTNTRNAAVEVIESTYPLYSLLFGSLSSRSLRHTRTTWTWASARR